MGNIPFMETQRKRICIRCLLLTALLALSACGKEERQRGLDGYIYVAQQLNGTAHWGYDVKNSDSWLYYLDNGALYRTPLPEDGSPVGTLGEMVPGSGKMYDYTVDAEGAIYYYSPEVHPLGFGRTELKNGTLSRYRPDGSLDYSLPLDGRSAIYATGNNPGSLVVGKENRVFLLMGDTVLVVNSAGEPVSETDISGIRPGSGSGVERLLEGEDGRVYYMALTEQTRIYELAEEGDTWCPQVCSLRGLEGENGAPGFDFYGSRSGLLYSSSDGILYRYLADRDTWEGLLRWGDSNLRRSASEVLWLSDGKLLASYQGYKERMPENEFYLLDRRNVEELPEKEELYLACWEQCPAELEDGVIRFNRSSDKYHITIQLYEDEAWLDARLVSSDPPDMLALLPMNVRKYGEKQSLEDLGLYLEESSVLSLEDFLEAPLAGYTIGGRLVGIPSEFLCCTLVADAPAARPGWRLEDIMSLTEAYPDRKLNGNYYFWNLENLCGDYIMDTFLDRESGVCRLDTEEFRSLLQWLEGCCGNLTEPYIVAEVPEPLISQEFVRNIPDFLTNVSRLEDGRVSLGYPSPDGTPRYQAGAFHAVGIVSKSRCKEGAWQFIEHFLSHLEADYGAYANMPTRRDLLDEMLENAMTPVYIMNGDEIALDRDGNPRMVPKWTAVGQDAAGNMTQTFYYHATEEEADGLLELISQADFSPENSLKSSVLNIIAEEAGSYLNGDKPLEEVTKIIQGRVSTLVQENL